MSQDSSEDEVIYDADFSYSTDSTVEATFEISPVIYDLNYTHYQDTPSSTWTIKHSLYKYPSVTIVTSAGDSVLADVYYTNNTQVEISFTAAFAGTAYLN